MKQASLIIIAICLNYFLIGQSQDVWVRFRDSVTEQSGYKDLKGNIKIPAKFEDFTRADSFYNIIAVNEKVDSSYKSYYLLKDGRKVGQDSVFMFEFTFDCESEGKIIYHDRKKDRVGFFDKNGVAIIPAIYNYVYPFRNGLAIAHRNAKRKCWGKDGDTTNCEHLGWEGGESVLINEKNEILADSIIIDLDNINWYSKKVNAFSIDTSIYVSIKGKNNITYSFVDYDKEFKKWFKTVFVPSLKHPNTLKNLLFTEITSWSEGKGWTALEKEEFLKALPEKILSARFETNKLKKISMSQDMFNGLIYDKELYWKYLNSCGGHNNDRFPLFSVGITYYKMRTTPLGNISSDFLKEYETDHQESFEFLRTEQGYKLLSAPIRN